MTTTVEQVKQCHTPQEALLVLAAAIDALAAKPKGVDLWAADVPLEWDAIVVTNDNRARIEGGDVIVDRVSADREVARAEFVAATQLYSFSALPPADFVEAYIKGGPRWLYYTDRDAVMTMPIGVRQALVADVLVDSPSEAAEIGADILKFAFDEGARETAGVEQQRENRELGPAYVGREVKS